MQQYPLVNYKKYDIIRVYKFFIWKEKIMALFKKLTEMTTSGG